MKGFFNIFKKSPQKEEEQKQDPKQEINQEDDFDEANLQEQDFDIDKIQEEAKDECLSDFSQDYPGYLLLTKEQIIELVQKYSLKPTGEDVRHELGHKNGGRICNDKQVISKLRGVGKEIVKQIGKKILTGSLNLTKVSFPIKAMIPKTALETSCHGRETLQGFFGDGTQVYGEQISHHPPVSYFLVYGPEKKYKYYGYYDYEAKAGLNSVQIINKGKRRIEFQDNGQQILFDFPNELYSGTFMGTMKQESQGKMSFQDITFGFSVEILIGKVKKRPSDYFSGSIMSQGKEICKITGTYLGYIDFDDLRYWEFTNMVPHKITFYEGNQCLESDHHKRSDLITLKSGDVKKGQVEKERLEEEQRQDRKWREEYQKQKEKELKEKQKKKK